MGGRTVDPANATLFTLLCAERPRRQPHLCRHGWGGRGPCMRNSIYANMRGQTSQTTHLGQHGGVPWTSRTLLYLRCYAGKDLADSSIYGSIGGRTMDPRTQLYVRACAERPRRQPHLCQHGGMDRGPREHKSIYAVMRGKTSRTAQSIPAWGEGPWTLRIILEPEES